MSDLPASGRNFVGVSAVEAVYHAAQVSHRLLLELRRSADGTMRLFTEIGGQQIQARSIHEFILARSDCKSLAIPHRVRVLWQGVPRVADLLEVFIPRHDEAANIHVQLRLDMEGSTYETEPCATLSDAVRELRERFPADTEWWLQTCHHCAYSSPFLLGPGWDDRDDLQCYRDAREALAEVRWMGKFAGYDTLHAGDYFVNAFHTCAAWRPSTAD